MSTMYSPGGVEPSAPDRSGGGLAIASLVLGIIGLLLFPLALIGLILGIIAVSKSGERNRGMAIAGLILSAVGLVFGCLSVGILLPALGKARQSARQIKSSTQMRGIGQALIMYAQNNQDMFPEAGSDWQKRVVDSGFVTDEMFTAPHAKPGDTSYFYVPGGKNDFDATQVLLIENPEFYRGRGGNIMFEDNMVQYLEGDEFWQHVEKARAQGAELPFTRTR